MYDSAGEIISRRHVPKYKIYDSAGADSAGENSTSTIVHSGT